MSSKIPSEYLFSNRTKSEATPDKERPPQKNSVSHPRDNDKQTIFALKKSSDELLLSSRRAASEAIEIGRETAATLSRQGESIARADGIADENQYILDRSERVLRGMTWPGWFANMITSDVKRSAPSEVTEKLRRRGKEGNDSLCLPSPPVSILDNTSNSSSTSRKIKPEISQVLNDFQQNVRLAQQCEDPKQKKLLLDVVCYELGLKARRSVEEFEATLNGTNSMQLAGLQRQLEVIETLYQELIFGKATITAILNNARSTSSNPSPSTKNTVIGMMAQQDVHLSELSTDLSELKSLGHIFQESIQQQNAVLESLDGKSENLLDQTKLLVRKGDRLTQKAMWRKAKSTFVSNVKIMHIPTKSFISVSRDNPDNLQLTPQYLRNGSLFSKNQKNNIFGLKNCLTKKWLGQGHYLGGFTCSSQNFERKEEWEIMEGGAGSTVSGTNDLPGAMSLLCVSANWGNGGYLVVKDSSFTITKNVDLESRRQSLVWRLEEVE